MVTRRHSALLPCEMHSHYSLTDIQERKPDMTLEDSLTNDKLKELEQLFRIFDEDDSGGLDMEEFRNVMRQVNGEELSDNDCDTLFMKVDTNCDGTVDWDELLSYILLEYQERDAMKEIMLEKLIPSKMWILPNIFKHQAFGELIVQVSYLPRISKSTGIRPEDPNFGKHGKYVTVTKEGTINFWSESFQHMYTAHLPKPQTIHQKLELWVTAMAVIEPYNTIAIASTTGNLMFFDVSAFSFVKTLVINNLDICVTCLSFYYDKVHPDHGILLFGDARGSVMIVDIEDGEAGTKLFGYPNTFHAGFMSLDELLHSNIKGIRTYRHRKIHMEMVIDVRYFGTIASFISIANNLHTPMRMGDIEGKQIYTFESSCGISSFDFYPKTSIIVTGSKDAEVRIWNPHNTRKPQMILRGHTSPIMLVQVDRQHEKIVTVSVDREIIIFDMLTHSIVERVQRKHIHLGERLLTAAFYNHFRTSLIIATNQMGVFEHQEEEIQRQKFITQDEAFTAICYNSLFDQIVVGSSKSHVSVWNPNSGELTMQFTAHKRLSVVGHEISVELTCMTFDPTERRLITAGRDGCVKIWNFNNGALLRVMENTTPSSEITGIVCPPKRIITAGWDRVLYTFVDSSEDLSMRTWEKKHNAEITHLAFRPPSTIASGDNHGDILIWTLETFAVSMRLNANVGRRPCTFKDLKTPEEWALLRSEWFQNLDAPARRRLLQQTRHVNIGEWLAFNSHRPSVSATVPYLRDKEAPVRMRGRRNMRVIHQERDYEEIERRRLAAILKDPQKIEAEELELENLSASSSLLHLMEDVDEQSTPVDSLVDLMNSNNNNRTTATAQRTSARLKLPQIASSTTLLTSQCERPKASASDKKVNVKSNKAMKSKKSTHLCSESNANYKNTNTSTHINSRKKLDNGDINSNNSNNNNNNNNNNNKNKNKKNRNVNNNNNCNAFRRRSAASMSTLRMSVKTFGANEPIQTTASPSKSNTCTATCKRRANTMKTTKQPGLVSLASLTNNSAAADCGCRVKTATQSESATSKKTGKSLTPRNFSSSVRFPRIASAKKPPPKVLASKSRTAKMPGLRPKPAARTAKLSHSQHCSTTSLDSGCMGVPNSPHVGETAKKLRSKSAVGAKKVVHVNAERKVEVEAKPESESGGKEGGEEPTAKEEVEPRSAEEAGRPRAAAQSSTVMTLSDLGSSDSSDVITAETASVDAEADDYEAFECDADDVSCVDDVTTNNNARSNTNANNQSFQSIDELSELDVTSSTERRPLRKIMRSRPSMTSQTSSASTNSMEGDFERDDVIRYDTHLRKNEAAIERLLFLSKRENDEHTANLIAVCASGWLRFWSTHVKGGLIGQFNAARKKGDSVHALCADSKEEYLITGDSAGYIRVWDISEYCNQSTPTFQTTTKARQLRRSKFPLYEIDMTNLLIMQRSQADHRPPPRCTEPCETWSAPQLLNSFRGHLDSITGIVYIERGERLATCSSDRSVRMWTIYGRFIGIFAQDTPWATHNLTLPRHRVFLEPSETADRFMVPNVKTNVIPGDVKRIASATTLRVMMGGRTKYWRRTKNIIMLCMKSLKAGGGLQSKLKGAVAAAKQEQAKTPTPEPQQEQVVQVEDLAEVLSPQAPRRTAPLRRADRLAVPKYEPMKRECHIGKHFRTSRKHRPLPDLPKPRCIKHQIDAFSTLPCYELATAPTVPMLPTVLDLMERQRVLTHSKQELKKKIKRGFKKPTTFDVDKFMKQKRRGVLFAKIVRAMHNARETEVPQDATSTESDTEFVRAARRMVLRRGNLQVDPMERF